MQHSNARRLLSSHGPLLRGLKKAQKGCNPALLCRVSTVTALFRSSASRLTSVADSSSAATDTSPVDPASSAAVAPSVPMVCIMWSLPESRYNCPTTGSLTTGQGNRYAPCHSQIVVCPHTRSRFVLASTAELHEKISDLSVRVRTLEDALKESHALVSHERHPLLTDNLLQIKAPLQRDPAHLRNIPKNEIKQEDQSGEVVDAFGSLSINAFGGANYYGSIANSWVSASHNSIYCPSLFQYSFSSR